MKKGGFFRSKIHSKLDFFCWFFFFFSQIKSAMTQTPIKASGRVLQLCIFPRKMSFLWESLQVEWGSLRQGTAPELHFAAPAEKNYFGLIPAEDSARALGYLLSTAEQQLGNSECQELSVLCFAFHSPLIYYFFFF